MSPEIVSSLIGCAISVVAVLYQGGKQVGRVEAAISRLSGIEVKLEKIEHHAVKIGTLETAYATLRSDHKELAREIRENSKETSELVGKFDATERGTLR